MLNSALVIIDMQNDFVCPSIFPANQRAFDVVPNIIKVLSSWRAKKLPVFHIVREYRSDGSNIEFMRVEDFNKRPRAVPGTPGCEIFKDLIPVNGEFRVVKWRFSAFMNTELDFLLRRMQINHLVVCGTQLPNCVRSTVYDAMALDYNVTLISDAVAARTQDVHDANLIDIKNLGVECIEVNQLLSVGSINGRL